MSQLFSGKDSTPQKSWASDTFPAFLSEVPLESPGPPTLSRHFRRRWAQSKPCEPFGSSSRGLSWVFGPGSGRTRCRWMWIASIILGRTIVGQNQDRRFKAARLKACLANYAGTAYAPPLQRINTQQLKKSKRTRSQLLGRDRVRKAYKSALALQSFSRWTYKRSAILESGCQWWPIRYRAAQQFAQFCEQILPGILFLFYKNGNKKFMSLRAKSRGLDIRSPIYKKPNPIAWRIRGYRD